jgi:hypothetical protein
MAFWDTFANAIKKISIKNNFDAFICHLANKFIILVMVFKKCENVVETLSKLCKCIMQTIYDLYGGFLQQIVYHRTGITVVRFLIWLN